MKFLWLTLFLVAAPAFAAAPACDDSGKIYKVCADQSALFAQAIVAAKKEKKLLLVAWGADWCAWCHSLHTLLDEPKFRRGRGQGFHFVDIALYTGREPLASGQSVLERVQRMAGVKEKQKGIPLLALMNPRTKRAVFIPTEPLEENTEKTKGHSAEKVYAAIDEAREKLR